MSNLNIEAVLFVSSHRLARSDSHVKHVTRRQSFPVAWVAKL